MRNASAAHSSRIGMARKVVAIGLTALLVAATGAAAQEYPTRPVRLIVATSPGGGTDTLARILAANLGELLGQTFVVDNRPGGSGIIGTDLVARATADGYTLLMGFIASLAITPALTKTPYDVARDLAAVSLVADAQYLLVVNPSLPVHSVQEFVAYAKANPGRINVASAGFGTPVHMSAELFKLMSGIDIVIVPYKGGGPAAAAVLAGEAQAIFGSVSATLPQIKAGKLVALGTTGSRRSIAAPQYPTIAEQGYPGFEVTSWYALMAPAGTPPAVIGKLNGAVQEVLRNPEARKQMDRQGLEPTGGSPAAAAAHIARETETWRRVIREAGIKAP